MSTAVPVPVGYVAVSWYVTVKSAVLGDAVSPSRPTAATTNIFQCCLNMPRSPSASVGPCILAFGIRKTDATKKWHIFYLVRYKSGWDWCETGRIPDRCGEDLGP